MPDNEHENNPDFTLRLSDDGSHYVVVINPEGYSEDELRHERNIFDENILRQIVESNSNEAARELDKKYLTQIFHEQGGLHKGVSLEQELVNYDKSMAKTLGLHTRAHDAVKKANDDLWANDSAPAQDGGSA